MKWFCSLFTIRTSSITHLVLSPHTPPQNKCVTLVFHFSWVLQDPTTVPRETENNAYVKLGAGIMGHFGRCASGGCVMSINCNGQEPC